MIFNSTEFLIFFFVFFFLYWFVCNKKLKAQNYLILLASYAFYAWWDWRFLFLIIATTLLNYLFGKQIEKASNLKNKRFLFFLSLLFNLGTLLIFKYFDFFISSFNYLSQTLGNSGDLTLRLILPLGISFYTFRMVSYIIDVKNEKIKAADDYLKFSCYVAFFPSLVSGPIDKAKNLLPQFSEEKTFNYELAKNGSLQILWGWFKKAVIADNCANITDYVFTDHNAVSASWLWLAAFLYTIQIYADFSGYSDMAIGLSKLIGFKITKNFNFPLFAQNIAEFWRRWHISLTNWLTEYVFTPLSIYFRDYNRLGLILSIIINFTLIGIWHGNKWSFVLFGFLHGCYYIPLIIKGTINKKKKEDLTKILPSPRQFLNIAGTFTLVTLTFILFRAESTDVAWGYFKRLFSSSILQAPTIDSTSQLIKLAFVIIFMVIEWLGRGGEYAIEMVGVKFSRPVRWAIYYSIVAIIFVFAGSNQQFIYFQF